MFPRARVAVFVDGCFWHQCPQHATVPQNNADWWRAKLDRNVERDRATDEILKSSGWMPLRIWEHEDPRKAALKVGRVVRRRLGVRDETGHGGVAK